MGVSSVNTYNSLDEQVKLKRSQSVQNTISRNLYGALMMTEENSSAKESKNNRIKDILTFNNKEQLSELDKEKILHVLDYLRIKWITNDVFKSLKTEDFAKIKSYKTSGSRADALIQIIIDKSGESLWISKDKIDKELKPDIEEHVNSAIAWRNAEVGNNIAEEISLKKISLNRFRHFWAKIRDILKKNNLNISKCYMDIIKLANYSSINWFKRAWTRYIVPVRFWWRNIHKQTQKTLDALKQRSESSDNQVERLSINYIIKNLREAYRCFKDSMWPSNKEFDQAQFDNENRIKYTAAA